MQRSVLSVGSVNVNFYKVRAIEHTHELKSIHAAANTTNTILWNYYVFISNTNNHWTYSIKDLPCFPATLASPLVNSAIKLTQKIDLSRTVILTDVGVLFLV